jgi:3-oxo-5-alpha-steroid 4-dehydrogenase 1
MDLDAIYHWGTLGIFATAAIAFPVLFWITVPYGGRHTSESWGPSIPSRLAWFLMEVPAPAFLLVGYSLGRHAGGPVSLLLLSAFLIHYAHRAIVYPLRMPSNSKRTPVLSATIALCVNIANGTINGLAVSHASEYGYAWLADPRFLLGAAVFIAGSVINLRSDEILRNLRAPGEHGYKIPQGGFYRWVSCPNYFGEIVQWAGWALATWSTAGLAFLLLTTANLAPRARSNHRWYREQFPDYPPERKALIPHVW